MSKFLKIILNLRRKNKKLKEKLEDIRAITVISYDWPEYKKDDILNDIYKILEN